MASLTIKAGESEVLNVLGRLGIDKIGLATQKPK